jgi:hypothetical protein
MRGNVLDVDVTYGAAGWVRVEGQELPTYVRLSKRGEVRAVFVDGDGQEVRAAFLRQLPLAQAVAVAEAARPDLAAGMARAPDPNIEEALMAAFPDRAKRLRPTIDVGAELARPTAGLTDDFLHSVAAAYLAAVARGDSPNQALAEQAGAPARSVERWVYLTRKRGYLRAGGRGRIG